MKDKIVDYEVAKLAKEVCFSEETYMWYTLEGNLSIVSDFLYNHSGRNLISAPTQSLLQRWLRELHNINIGMTYFKSNNFYNNHWECRIHYLGINISRDTYEEALEEGLKQVLLLIKNK